MSKLVGVSQYRTKRNSSVLALFGTDCLSVCAIAGIRSLRAACLSLQPSYLLDPLLSRLWFYLLLSMRTILSNKGWFNEWRGYGQGKWRERDEVAKVFCQHGWSEWSFAKEQPTKTQRYLCVQTVSVSLLV